MDRMRAVRRSTAHQLSDARASQLPVLTRTKLYRPPLPTDYVPRPRLSDQLKPHTVRRLTLLSAPAGFGKTTLLSAWLAQSELPNAWLSLDENDNDVVTFLSYFIAAVQTIFPDAARATQALTNALTLPPLAILTVSLINELDELDEPFILVLDDYQVIQALPIHALMEELLRHSPRPLRLMIASRFDPPFGLGLLRAHGQTIELRAEDLRFSLQETHALVRAALGTQVEAGFAEALHARVEGWVTGLRLAMLSLRLHEREKTTFDLLPARDRNLVEYLGSQVLSQQPPAVQKFLIESSILERFSGALCEAITGLGDDEVCDGQAYIEWLEQHELFVVRTDASGQWFRFHQIFREFLQARLAATYSTEDISTLHRRAAQWFAAHDLRDEALRHAIAGGDLAQAANLVEEHRRALLDELRLARLEGWLQLLPRRVIEERPALLLAQAWVEWYRGKLAEVIALVDRAEGLIEWSHVVAQDANLDAGARQLVMPKDTPGAKSLRGEAATLRSYQYYWMGEFTRSHTQAQIGLNNTPRESLLVRAAARMFLAMTSQAHGDLDEANRVIQEGLNEAGTNRTDQLRNSVTPLFMYWANAYITRVRDTAMYMLELDKNQVHPELFHWANKFLGSVHYQRNELSEAEHYLQAVVKERHLAYAAAALNSAFALALTYQAQDQPEQARATLEMLQGFLAELGNGTMLPLVQAFQAELALRQGLVPVATQWAMGARPGALVPAPLFYTPSLTLPKVLLAQDTAESCRAAVELLSRFGEFYEQTHNVYASIQVLALQALLYQQEGDRTAALTALERALSLAEPGGFIRLFADFGSPMGEMLKALYRRNSARRYVGQILDALMPVRSPVPNISQAAMVEPLTPRELKILTLLAQGLSNKEIAAQEVTTVGTVKQYNLHIYQKLLVTNRADALAKARALGLLPAA